MKYFTRVIQIHDKAAAAGEFASLGVHLDGIKIMSEKAIFRAVKLYGIRPAAANIIKQEMLSRGGDAAVAHGTINNSIKETDAIIFGTLSQFKELISKLKHHQFDLPSLALEIGSALEIYDRSPKPLKVGRKIFEFGKRTHLMGILNVTPDSFSDGGKFFSLENAVARGVQMEREGADMIDVGGESTRPGARALAEKEEIARVVPVIKGLRKKIRIPISIDTTKSRVARAAVLAGADAINDISGLHFDPKLAKVAADFQVPLVLMHILGRPRTMQKSPRYKDLIKEILENLADGIRIAGRAGVKKESLVIDPGIGFGKTLEHNLEILRHLSELKVLGLPILVGVSRKSMIGKVLGLPPEERLDGTGAAVAAAVMNGADIVRVHDVREMKRVVEMTDAIVRRK